MTESSTVTGARRELGIQLAALRKAAGGMSQGELAELTGWSRSTVANVEAGRQTIGVEFFERCDEVLQTGGALGQGWHDVEAIVAAVNRQKAEDARLKREAHLRNLPQAEVVTASIGGGATSIDSLNGEVDHVVEKAFEALQDGGSGDEDHGAEDLQQRALAAYQMKRRKDDQLSLTLVGGFAGSGKSEFARFLSAVTGWTILDKDTLTRALAEQLLIAHGGDANDRQSPLYLEQVRPYEYRCLIDSGIENLKSGVSTVLTAPFLKEFSDPNWLLRFQNRCKMFNAVFSVVWVKVDTDSMFDYVSYRGAARDSWKLTHWPEYLASIDTEYRPDFPHYLVDNSLNAAVALADQARDIATRMKP